MKVAKRVSVIAGVLAAVICSSTSEAAAQQQPILGCVKPGTGMLRIPSGNEGCKRGETPLGFNDLPLLVALRDLVNQLQAQVVDLKTRVEALEADLATAKACTDSIEACNQQ